MARWNSETGQIEYFEPRQCPDNPGWLIIDCGCCNGIRWGGCSPIECNRCLGEGIYYKHIKSGVLAQYPGGPLMGREAND